MDAIFANIQQSFTQMLGWELVAVILAIAYLLLILRENIWGWYCAFFSTAIYTLLFWEVSLLMDSALNVYYMGMAVFGWWQWQHGDNAGSQQLTIKRWAWRKHLIAMAAIVTASLISGYLLDANTEAAWPYLDSFTTWASVFTTWLVTRKILENWLYWIVIDAVACFLYVDRALYLTALLFAAYTLICLFGYARWRRTFQQQNAVG